MRDFLSCHSSSAGCTVPWEENLNCCKHPSSQFNLMNHLLILRNTVLDRLQIWGLSQALMRELFSYVVPDGNKKWLRAVRTTVFCFRLVGPFYLFFFIFFNFFCQVARSVGGAKASTRRLPRPVGSSSGSGCGRLVRWMDCAARTLLSARRTTESSLLCGFKWNLARFKVTVQKTPAEISCAAEAVGFWGFPALNTFTMNALKTNFNFS